ncbi:class II histone deacetylase [Micromonospora fiedleri]|uniref:Class II histone deacetylase n=1 Tax=Micromonospora fiedleri TaxID=1157498 RepID=A0ABS1UV54_9ACTN|nr:class II histone deacetylase [Micromonospora fiedleri]MBL6280248.1 class II histone deacetylase [Micromonospora fiedleri]
MTPHPAASTDIPRPTGYVYHPLFAWHDTGTSAGLRPADPLAGVQPGKHVEAADAKRRTHELIHACGLLRKLVVIEPREATMTELLRVHTGDHVQHIKEQSERSGGDAGDGFSPVGRGSYDIARLAAGGLVELVTAVVKGELTRGYALTRPPGHHATADTSMGFCLFNSLAVAARHAQAELGLPRIAIVDWDAHHGNGTQSIFYTDPTVLTISLHQALSYPPNSGWIHEHGVRDGTGYALNVPLPAGSGHAAYVKAMRQVVLPALDRFKPDLILLAAGFDANAWDPMSRQVLTADSYRTMTRLLVDAADRLCHGRLVAAHEGGYNPWYVPFCVLAFLEELSGHTTGIPDPYADIAAEYAAEPLLRHQDEVIQEATEFLKLIRPPTTARTSN